MILEKYKRITLDALASSTAWILFFIYRKVLIEESVFEFSFTLLYGTIGVTLFFFLKSIIGITTRLLLTGLEKYFGVNCDVAKFL